jgi:spermidine synthase
MSTDTLAPAAPPQPTVRLQRPLAALFLISVLGLFLELLLIRWVGTEVRIFAYLQNTILVVCFLGLGMGCWTAREPFAPRQVLIPLTVLVVVLAIPFTRHGLGRLSALLSTFSGFLIWFQAVSDNALETVLLGIVSLGIILGLLLLIWDIFVPIGRLLGRLLDDHPRPIAAYSVNIAGSLAGIWLFVLLSALYQPPVAWLTVVVLLFLSLGTQGKGLARLDAVLLVALLPLGYLAGVEPGAFETYWSPYQKLVLRPPDLAADDIGIAVVNVNNVGYQGILDLSPKYVAEHADLFPAEIRGLSQYDLPARLHPQPGRVLIVGAGTGNDAAGALRQGAREVVAVEIDPAIIKLGKDRHPERPYQNPAVHIVNDDARSYFATAPAGTFDVISFGLLDSHTTTAMTNARLDHYVYTRESLQAARALLKRDGVMVLSFEVQKPFIADRMARALREVFDGQEPLLFDIPRSASGWGGVMFVAGNLEAARKQIDADPRFRVAVQGWQQDIHRLPGTTPVATDDWPYIYLESPRIPLLFFLLAALLALLFVRGAWRLGLRSADLLAGWQRQHWHFFFLGAAFMLLETQNISKASVVLGNTWLVNAVVISGILALILGANLAAACWPRLPLVPICLLLIGSCLGLYFVDLSSFAALPYAAKALAVGGLTCLPMLFSGLVFIRSFAATSGKDRALAANMLGALAGGLLQSITFLTGIQALLLLVACLYTAAVVTLPREMPGTEGQAAPDGPLQAGSKV